MMYSTTVNSLRNLFQCLLCITIFMLVVACGGGGGGGGGGVTPIASDTTPNAFAFTTQTGVGVNLDIVSDEITVTGIDAAAPISITGGEYSIDTGDYTSNAGTVTNGQTVTLRLTSSSDFETTTTATLTIGGVSGDFSVVTGVMLDSEPSPFSFEPQTGVEQNIAVTSNAITVLDINTASDISITGGEYAIDEGSFTSDAGTVISDQTVVVRLTSSTEFETTTTATLTIGGVSDDFNVETWPMDSTPDAFSFTTQTNVPMSSVITSNALTMNSINVAVNVSVVGGEYSIDDGEFVTTAGTINRGQSISVRHSTPLELEATSLTTLTIGGIDGEFTSITTPVNAAPNWDVAEDLPLAGNLIAEGVTNASYLFNVDIDGDGDVDVLSATGSSILLHRNNGETTPTFTEEVLSTDRADVLWVADMDGDTDLDLIAGNSSATTIYMNNGETPAVYVRESTDFRRAGALFVADINGDSSLDVITASVSGVHLYTNDGTLTPIFSETTIGTASTDDLYVADIDGDLDLDVFGSRWSVNTINWYENNGASTPVFTQQTINPSLTWVGDISGADMDGDGDQDLIAGSAFNGKVTWVENDGASEPTFKAREILDRRNDVNDIIAKDMDADGDFDIVIATETSVVSWYENDGSEKPGFRQHNSSADVASIFTGDINNNGLQELLRIKNNAVMWFPITQRSIWHIENSSLVLTDTASSPESLALSYAINGGADQALFTINTSTAELNFIDTPTFATPNDANSDGIYEVIISVSDIFSTINRIVRITVVVNDDDDDDDGVPDADDAFPLDPRETVDTDGDNIGDNADTDDDGDGTLDTLDNAPLDATSYSIPVWDVDTNELSGIAERNIFHLENTLSVLTETASDEDGNIPTYAIVGGLDALLFTINTATGELSFVSAPLVSAPSDSNGDNLYELTLSATDGFSVIERTVAVTVYVDDNDDDNDGVDDSNDAYPLDPYEQFDSDGDGIGNNADDDDDGDGNLDYEDNAPASLDSLVGPGWLTNEDEPPVGSLIAENITSATFLFDVDIDADGDIDVVSAGSQIVLLRNNGDAAPTFTEEVLSTDSADVVWVADMDGDTHLDIVAGTSSATTIYMNDGATPAVYVNQSSGFNRAEALFVADLNGDSRLDVITASSGGVHLYTNDGTLTPSFTETTIGTASADSLHVADIDGDLDLDVFGSETFRGSINWYENDGALTPVFTQQTISNSLIWVGGISGADMDGDGDQDLVAGSRFRGTVQWFENDGGGEPTFQARDVGGNVDIEDIIATDMDADGDFDIVTATDLSAVSWYENDGSESPSFSLHNTAVDAQVTFTGDITGDGIQELLSVQNDTISWFSITKRFIWHAENTLLVQPAETGTDADGNALTYAIVGGADALKFTINASTAELSFVSAPEFATPTDANADNFYEVLISVSDGYSASNRLMAIRVFVDDEDDDDDGVLDIDDAFPTDPTEWLDTDGDGIGNNADTDDDNDGTLDTRDNAPLDASSQTAPEWDLDTNEFSGIAERNIFHLENTLSVLTETASDEDGNIPTYDFYAGENEGGEDEEGDEPNGLMVHEGPDASLFTIDSTTGELRFKTAPLNSTPGDANGDNIYEVVIAATDGFSVIERTIAVTVYVDDNDDDNDGVDDSNDTFPLDPYEQFDSDGDGIGNNADDDDDGDGFLDFEDNAPASLDSRVGPTWLTSDDLPPAGNLLAENVTSTRFLFDVDIDGDGDIDVVSAGSQIVLLRNNGDAAPTFTEEVLSTDSADVVWVADMDGDTHLDIVAGTSSATTIYMNDGATPAVYVNQSSGFNRAEALFVADLNGDSRLDVITASSGGVHLYTNDGTLTPSFTETTIGTASADSLHVADIDGDLDLDVFGSETFRSSIYWYENDGASTPAFTRRFISSSLNWVGGISGADMDGDGDQDLVAGSRFRGTVQWLENNGAREPSFQARDIGTGDDVDDIIAKDMDGDGDFDIVVATDFSEVSWYENDGSESPSFSLYNTAAESLVTFAGDITGDGIQELLSAQNNTISWFTIFQRSVTHETGTLMVQLTETATDGDGNILTYEIIGGADQLLFSIDSATAELNFLVAPVFGSPSDANGDEIYEVLISVSDGFSTLNRFIAVEVLAP